MTCQQPTWSDAVRKMVPCGQPARYLVYGTQPWCEQHWRTCLQANQEARDKHAATCGVLIAAVVLRE